MRKRMSPLSPARAGARQGPGRGRRFWPRPNARLRSPVWPVSRTDRIAAEAGVNKALLYYYFKNKEALYRAVLEDHFQEFDRQALAVLAGPGSAQKEVLLRYVSLHLDFISARHRHAPLFQQFIERRREAVGEAGPQILLPAQPGFQRPLGARHCARGSSAGPTDFTPRFPIMALIVFYFSAAPVLHLLGHVDAYDATNLKRRKQEVLHVHPASALFADP